MKNTCLCIPYTYSVKKHSMQYSLMSYHKSVLCWYVFTLPLDIYNITVGYTDSPWAAVPSFNSCTKCLGSPGIKYDRKADCHPVLWAWMRPPSMTSQLDRRSFDSQATSWVTDVLTLFCKHIINWCLYNLSLADVRSTDAGIKYLYCTVCL